MQDRNLDFSYSLPTQNGEKAQRFRANAYFDLEHLALNMRKIDEEIRPFKTLDVHPEVAKALSLKYYKYGLTLITGITGSGKSSTLRYNYRCQQPHGRFSHCHHRLAG